MRRGHEVEDHARVCVLGGIIQSGAELLRIKLLREGEREGGREGGREGEYSLAHIMLLYHTYCCCITL